MTVLLHHRPISGRSTSRAGILRPSPPAVFKHPRLKATGQCGLWSMSCPFPLLGAQQTSPPVAADTHWQRSAFCAAGPGALTGSHSNPFQRDVPAASRGTGHPGPNDAIPLPSPSPVTQVMVLQRLGLGDVAAWPGCAVVSELLFLDLSKDGVTEAPVGCLEGGGEAVAAGKLCPLPSSAGRRPRLSCSSLSGSSPKFLPLLGQVWALSSVTGSQVLQVPTLPNCPGFLSVLVGLASGCGF